MTILRLLVKPRWLVRHLVVIGMCVGFFFLSRWQFHRGEETSGTVQNYGYSIEWLAFGGCVCFGWWKMLQDELHPDGVTRRNRPMVAREPRSSPWRTPTASAEGAVEPTPAVQPPATARHEPHSHKLHATDGKVPATLLFGRRTATLTTALIDPDDEEVVAYNAYLADLNAGRIRR